MKKKKIILIICIVILVVAVAVVIGYFLIKENEKNKQIESYFIDKETISSQGDIVDSQKKKDEEIRLELENASCTFDSPCIIKNPYEISPLTALIIFQSAEDTTVKVSINGTFVTTMESSTVHSIPIYGLQAGIQNKVTLEMADKKKEIIIDTTDISKGNLQVDISNPNATLNSPIYFLAGTMGTSAAAYDGNGNIVWYLTENYTLDMEFLDNGHILLSNNRASGISYTYDGFIEIDYLGKIYHNYSLKNGYHHEIIELNDGTFMVAGGSDDTEAPYISDMIYRINKETGEVLDSLTIYEIFAGIDQEFADSLTGTNMIVNSVWYDEETDECIISIRGFNAVASVQYKEKKLNWLFSDPTFFSEKFEPYLLEVTDNSRYPKGQHTAYLTEDGNLTVFNNDYNVLETGSAYLIDYQNSYSSAVIYEIDGKEIKTLWEYDGNKEYFNYALGSFILDEDSKLINFGWSYKAEAYREGVTIYDYAGNTYARIVELNDNDEEIFSATIEEGIYRAYKHTLYNEITPNYSLDDFALIDNNDKSALEKVKTESLFTQLEAAIENPYDFELTSTTITMNVIFNPEEVVDILFVGRDDESYIYHYKSAGEIINSKLNLQLEGEYAVYLQINDELYDTGKILNFEK